MVSGAQPPGVVPFALTVFLTQGGHTDKVGRRKRSRAHQAVAQAIANGTLVRPPQCSKCQGFGPVEAHHSDYDQPLAVEWLCIRCHVGVRYPDVLRPPTPLPDVERLPVSIYLLVSVGVPIGPAVRCWLDQTGLTWGDIADKYRIDPKVFSRVLNGNAPYPAERHKQAMCEVFGVSRKWLDEQLAA